MKREDDVQVDPYIRLVKLYCLTALDFRGTFE